MPLLTSLAVFQAVWALTPSLMSSSLCIKGTTLFPAVVSTDEYCLCFLYLRGLQSRVNHFFGSQPLYFTSVWSQLPGSGPRFLDRVGCREAQGCCEKTIRGGGKLLRCAADLPLGKTICSALLKMKCTWQGRINEARFWAWDWLWMLSRTPGSASQYCCSYLDRL